jgi:hypothetical protein
MEIPERHRLNLFVFVDRSAPDVPADGYASGADWFLHSVTPKKLRAFTPPSRTVPSRSASNQVSAWFQECDVIVHRPILESTLESHPH